MANTAFSRSMIRVDVFQTIESYRPALSTDWSMVCSWYIDPPYEGVFWYFMVNFDANVDVGTIGEVRFVCSTGEVSTPARIWKYVERVTLGPTYMTDNGPKFVWLQARQSAETTNYGGGIHIPRAAALLMSAPPPGWEPGPRYPFDYDPNGSPVPSAPYPPSYATPDPYG